MAKSRLEDSEIPCVLADENAHLYGGAPFAMPVRILVPNEYIARAGQILDATEGEVMADPEAIPLLSDPEAWLDRETKNNPWEFLVIALVFFGPGLALLLQRRPVVLIFGRAGRNRPLLTPGEVHLLGITLIAVALIVVFFYFRLYRAIRREADSERVRS